MNMGIGWKILVGSRCHVKGFSFWQVFNAEAIEVEIEGWLFHQTMNGVDIIGHECHPRSDTDDFRV